MLVLLHVDCETVKLEMPALLILIGTQTDDNGQ